MTKVVRQNVKKAAAKKKIKDIALPFTKENYMILALGVAVLIVGYICLAIGGAYDALSLVVAPIILVIGYCVIIPFSIFYKKKDQDKAESI